MGYINAPTCGKVITRASQSPPNASFTWFYFAQRVQRAASQTEDKIIEMV